MFDPTYRIYSWNFVPFSLSPDDKQLAYINNFDDETQLVIRDMKTGNEKSRPFRENKFGKSVTEAHADKEQCLGNKNESFAKTVNGVT